MAGTENSVLGGPVASYIAANGATYEKKSPGCPERLYARRIKSGVYAVIDDVLHKRCSRCKDHWPADTEFFYASKSEHDGLYAWCKACYQQWRYPVGRSTAKAPR